MYVINYIGSSNNVLIITSVVNKITQKVMVRFF